jgi:hypothetical protein
MSTIEEANVKTIEKRYEEKYSELKKIIELEHELKEQTKQSTNLKLETEKKQSEMALEINRLNNSNSSSNIWFRSLVALFLLASMACIYLKFELEIKKMKNSDLSNQLVNLNDEKDAWQEKYESLLSDVLLKGREFEDNESKYSFCVAACRGLGGFFRVAIGWIPGTQNLLD